MISIPEHSCYDTVAVAFQDERLRSMMIKSLSLHNHVFDPYEESPIQASTILDIPCFIHFLDFETYQANAERIVTYYQNCDVTKTSPMIVYGLNIKLYDHPLIINALTMGADYCRRLYRNIRRKAKRKVLCY